MGAVVSSSFHTIEGCFFLSPSLGDRSTELPFLQSNRLAAAEDRLIREVSSKESFRDHPQP